MKRKMAKILWNLIKSHVKITSWKSPDRLAIEFEIRIFGFLAYKTEITEHEIVSKRCL